MAGNGLEFSVATASATTRHRQIALAIVVALIVACAIIATYADIRLPQVNSFIPTVYSIIVVADLITAVLLYAQFSATGARPLLVLAGGYLFSGLIVSAHGLTFPGAFTPDGLLGAGPQTSAWLNVMWRLGLAAAMMLYALLRAREPKRSRASPSTLIVWSIIGVTIVVCLFTYISTAGHDLLPPLLSDGRILPLGRFANGVIVLINCAALALLVLRTRGVTVLDTWLIVAVIALIAESLMVTFFISERFTFGFYALRAISVPVSKAVLIVLLWETVRLYANLVSANQELQRERANRLNNAAAALAAIAHEIRQPLAGINLIAATGQKLMERTPPDADAAKARFKQIADSAEQAGGVFANVLNLFKQDNPTPGAVDANMLAAAAIDTMRSELDAHALVVRTDFAEDLPLVHARAKQLSAVIVNLLHNAIDTMEAQTDQPAIRIVTSAQRANAVSIALEYNGPVLLSEDLASMFDPFVATCTQGDVLSLAICRMIIEQHGGALSAQSISEGGARLEITLPVSAE